MTFYFYILISEKDQSFYIGQTQNLNARINRHNKGYNSATKSKLPWKLMCAFEVCSRTEAMKLEKKLKSIKKKSITISFYRKKSGKK